MNKRVKQLTEAEMALTDRSVVFFCQEEQKCGETTGGQGKSCKRTQPISFLNKDDWREPAPAPHSIYLLFLGTLGRIELTEVVEYHYSHSGR